MDKLPLLLPCRARFALDNTAKQVISELAKRKWEVPGIKVEIERWRSGEIDGMPLGGDDHRYVHRVLIPGEDCVLWYQHQGLDRSGAIHSAVIPGKALNVEYMAAYPTFFLYVGNNWYDNHTIFTSGQVFEEASANKHTYSRKVLRFRGSSEKDRIYLPSVHTIYDKTLAKSPYLVIDEDCGRNHTVKDEPRFFETRAVLDEFDLYIKVHLLDRIKALPIDSTPQGVNCTVKRKFRLSADEVSNWKRAIASYDESIVSEFCKKAACILIDASEGVTKPVKLITRDCKLGDLLRRGGHDMNSGNNYLITEPFRGNAYLGSCGSIGDGIMGSLVCLYLNPFGCPIGPYVNKDGGVYIELPFDPDAINSYMLPT